MECSNFHLDWLSFTFKDDSSTDLISDFFAMFPELGAYRAELVIVGGRNFAHGMTFREDFTIRYDDDNNGKGVNVEIPSHGLETFFSLFDGISTVRDMFVLLHDRCCLPSRIDCCFDDYNKVYRPVYYYKKFLSGAMVTRMRQVKMVHSGSDIDNTTFYLGDRRKKMIRIYDKFKESDGLFDCVRYEIEMHSKSACGFFFHIIDSDQDETVVFGDLLLDIFRICHINVNDSDKSRWKLNEKWFSFIRSTFSQRFITIPSYKTEQKIQNIEKHFQHNKKTFLDIIMYHGLSETLREVFADGISIGQFNFFQKLASDQGLPPDFYINRYDSYNVKLKGV